MSGSIDSHCSAATEGLLLRNVSVRYAGREPAIENVNLSVNSGEIVALLGESGAGKSTIAAVSMGLLPSSATYTGEVRALGADLRTLSSAALARLRGGKVGLTFQDPGPSMDPLRRLGQQLLEVHRHHVQEHDRAKAYSTVVALVESVGLLPADRFMRSFPHQLSGGQLQRAGLALALAGAPKFLIVDEPTSALDEQSAHELEQLLGRLRSERKLGVLLITHDQDLASRLADRTYILEGGTLVSGPKEEEAEQRSSATHTYEEAPNPTGGCDATTPTIELRDVWFGYRDRSGWFGSKRVDVLRGINLQWKRGECIGLVGASGSGKSTLARIILGLEPHTKGVFTLAGERIDASAPLRASHRRLVQFIPQDPLAALNPRRTLHQALEEPLIIHGIGRNRSERERAVDALLERVGLPGELKSRYPQELSGGERQRVVIARALAVEPMFLVCDEPTAQLDAANAARILAELEVLGSSAGLGILLISHDASVVARLAQRVFRLSEGHLHSVS